MNKKKLWRLIGIVFLVGALILSITVTTPFFSWVISATNISFSGSFSLLFLVIGLVTLSYSIFLSEK